jgi:hypothetical protein
MIRYAYNQQVSPPAPFVHVTLRCAEMAIELTDIPAQLDCAADRTAIPAHLVTELSLVPLDEIRVSGFGGQEFLVPSYRLELGVRGQPVAIVEVLAHAAEPFVLLGRDILNRHRIVLDGPRLALEIE